LKSDEASDQQPRAELLCAESPTLQLPIRVPNEGPIKCLILLGSMIETIGRASDSGKA
jgi:hypothetical protein